ncbi:glycerophosphodiester phosphodiesterase family protein [Fictibacillus terranigra]|uniref:Glycerophosphodiester phosphodiesterase family protein n=1 Tax=Fictibacillus terranigra TaxID=3058424 RepID=A0ABT8E8V7_9BACL|nr:glycerophosphodiester phosphodiesterase family protein [Fictibacillus sp. CENA-BCM004]MDN4074352.1 glycerophosphodiester phosphodiesterase family protein [Fictibacillus sp. CENA-BCM004]
MIDRLKDNSSLYIAGHRGYMAEYPENTLLSFQKALGLGVDMLEFDLRFSKDNILMVIHDETLNRTTDGKGKINDYTLNQLKQLNAGVGYGTSGQEFQIPTLDELCGLLKSYPEVLLNVEIKPSSNAREVADAAIAKLEEYNFLSRCVFTSFDAEIVAHIHDNYQLKTQGFPGQCMFNFVPGADGTYSKMWAVGISMKLLNADLVKEFKDLGILCWSYCPDNDQQVYQSLECGITLMTCNNPIPALKIRNSNYERA